MKISLVLLDKLGSVGYDNKVPVILEHDFINPIGWCEVFRGDDGRHYGYLALDRAVSHDLFFYYRQAVSDDGIFWFSGVQLLSKPLDGKATTRLHEKII